MAGRVTIRWEDIKILSTEPVEIYPAPEQVRRVLAVTYVYKDYAPRTVWIDEDKYTRQNLLKLIQEDMEKVIAGPRMPT